MAAKARLARADSLARGEAKLEGERQSERCRRSAQCDFRRKISSFFGSQFATSVRHLQLQSSTLISKEEEISFKKLAPQGRVSRASQGKGRSAISLALIIGRLLPICTRINNSSLSWFYPYWPELKHSRLLINRNQPKQSVQTDTLVADVREGRGAIPNAGRLSLLP